MDHTYAQNLLEKAYRSGAVLITHHPLFARWGLPDEDGHAGLVLLSVSPQNASGLAAKNPPTGFLREALRHIVRKQPKDPAEWVGRFVCYYADGMAETRTPRQSTQNDGPDYARCRVRVVRQTFFNTPAAD
jgi:hypothetical protein